MTEPNDQGEVAQTAEPATPVAATPVPRTSPSVLRLGIVAIGLVAIFAGAAASMAANRAATTGAATNTPASPDSGIVLNLGGDLGLGGGPGLGRHGFHEITITAISGSSISLKTADGWTRTITVDSATTFSKAGETIALGDLKVGDQVGFKQTLEDDGSYTIDAVAVILPHVGGEVTAIRSSTITVTQRDGTSATIKVTSDTTYLVGDDTSAALSDIAVGDFVVAEGTKNSDGSLTAARVASGHGGPGFRHHGPFGPNDDTDKSSDSSTEG
jgi:hypothetical protein